MRNSCRENELGQFLEKRAEGLVVVAQPAFLLHHLALRFHARLVDLGACIMRSLSIQSASLSSFDGRLKK